jgi:Na+/proline symporter/signal transduction histidine kinase/ActR/RegA family two-component response regulator
MLQGLVVVTVALGYIGLLFVVASYGDRKQRFGRADGWRQLIYPLSLAIYCTSWTYFGSVGLVSRTGFYEFFTVYLGPMIMIGLCSPLIMRIVRLAKDQNITSIADFIAARYGKAQTVAATVALIAIIGTVPYIALQLKAVSSSLSTILIHTTPDGSGEHPVVGDIAPLVALAMAAFATLFGTRHIDATEHQDGLMLAIATESIVKLVAFVSIGVFVTFWMFDGPFVLFTEALNQSATSSILANKPAAGTLLVMVLLSSFAIVLLPRQFHVTVVENHSEAQVRRAAWLFPLYLVVINLFVVPIALAGLLKFEPGQVDSDMFVLALPIAARSDLLTLVAFIGGLSAATAMVIVETVALSIMVSNDIIMPFVLQRRWAFFSRSSNIGWLLLTVRRIAIFAVLFLAYLYYRSAGDAQLASIGLLSFAAIAQLAPAFFGGLIWRRGTARGAIAGMSAGTMVWAYTLLLPSFAAAGIIGSGIVADGPWDIAMLRPQALFGLHLDPLTTGVFWSLFTNVLAYTVFSLARPPSAIERLQANLFVPNDFAPIAPGFRLEQPLATVEELTTTVARYLGEERTRASFESYASTRGIKLEPRGAVDFQLLRFAEYLLASAIGTASSRLTLSVLLRDHTVSTEDALKLLDNANTAIHYNREILQTALNHVRQGIAVFDKDLRLICWNHQFGGILDLTQQYTRLGTQLKDILHCIVERMSPDPSVTAALVSERIAHYGSATGPFLERFAKRDSVIEVRANKMPNGGIVTTFTDITPSVKAAEALECANESLEQRVQQRTEELLRLNNALGQAKADAEQANISKTRFLAAASHDILQPLNAARLYVTSLVERQGRGNDAQLITNIDASLDAVEEILAALLDISRLDTGALKPEISNFRLDELFRQIEVEFKPLAQEKGLPLDLVWPSLAVRSDRRLLRRILQNLVSNAIKYTPQGRVLVGCRRRSGHVSITVADTGIGIPQTKQRVIFEEFHRLDQGARVARGLGLGLSIVERISRMLDHRVDVISTVGKGSRFTVVVPMAAAIAASTPLEKSRMVDHRQLAGISVLCIDNDPTILDGMETLLGGWGCCVSKASDMETAIAAIAGTDISPDVLLVDYHLDHGNGLAAIDTLRLRLSRDIPAILITADGSGRVRREANACGIQVLNKPVKPAALRALLAQCHAQRIAAAE